MTRGAAIALAAALAATMLGCEESGNGVYVGQHDSEADRRFMTEDDWDHFEFVVDRETGVTYVLVERGFGKSARMGIAPLLNSDGTPVVDIEKTDR